MPAGTFDGEVSSGRSRPPLVRALTRLGVPTRASGGSRRPTAIPGSIDKPDAASAQRVGGSCPPGGVVGGFASHDGVAGGYETVSLAVGFTSTTTVRFSRRKASVGSTTHSSPSNTQPGQSSGLPAASTDAPG